MILSVNIGNTNTSIGFLKDNKIKAVKYPSDLLLSKENFTRAVELSLNEKTDNVTGIIISSVNPRLTKHIETAAEGIFGITPLTVKPSMKMKLDLSNYPASTIGSDRIAVCEAAVNKYELPLIVFDFGTATTINVVDSNACFIGGSILPGIATGINALAKDTALISSVELSSPTPLIGRNTDECVLSGAVFGAATILEGMSSRIEKELSAKATIIITGGNAKYVLPLLDKNKVINAPDLLPEGLNILYESNVVKG
ncbi:MAG: type III pantothenate kinase [Oscillospiraceae bacterium]|nr:type III pantothenate kinase [Oscillospiraceae bacterium]